MSVKSFLFILTITILLLEGCKKDVPRVPKPIEGNWELSMASGGIIGGMTTYPTGNGNIYKFSESNYEKYINGTLKKTGFYSTFQDTFYGRHIVMDRIVFDDDTMNRFTMEISDNKLTIQLDADDAPKLIYVQQ